MSSAVPLVPLGEIARISKGKKPKSLSLNAIDDTYLPYILIESFGSQYNQFTNDKTCRLVCESDIEIVWDGERAGLVSKGHKGYLGSTLASVSLTHESFDSEFIFYILQEKQKYLRQGAEGTGVPHLSRWVVENLSIYKLPLPEQKKIASILTSVDKVIENTQKQIDKLQDLKKATMNELLIKGIDHTEFKDSELGRIPKSWEVVSLEDVCEKLKPGPFGSAITKSMYVQEGYKVYGQEQVISGDVTIGDYYIAESKYEELAAFKVQASDVLISLVGTIGKSLIVPDKHFPGIINPRLIILRLNKTCIPTFMQYLLSSEGVQQQLSLTQQGGTMGVLSASVLKPLKLRTPPIEEQESITKVFSSLDNRIGKLKDKLTQTQSLKKSLMQDLLTGKVRVTVN